MQKKALPIFICVFIIASVFFSLPVSADYNYELSNKYATVGPYYLYNYENDLVLAKRDIDEAVAPASTAKMMTALVAFEFINDTNEVITVTDDLLRGSGGRSMGLKEGDRISLLDLLYATICGGYNDSAIVLANHLCGSESAFVEKMNDAAKILGMTSTVYQNATGLDSAGAETSVKDIKILADRSLKNPLFCEIASAKSYTLASSSTCEKDNIQNRSTLLSSFYGIVNLSFGSAKDGYCAVHYIEKDGLSYICIVMNALEKDKDDLENYGATFSTELLNYALYDFSYKTLIKKDEPVGTAPLLFSLEKTEIELYPADDVKVFLPKSIDTEEELTYHFYTYEKEIKATVKEGQILGKLLICKDDEVLAQVDLVSKGTYKANGFLVFMEFMKDYISSRAFIFAILLFAALMAAYYLYYKYVMRKIHRSSRYKK